MNGSSTTAATMENPTPPRSQLGVILSAALGVVAVVLCGCWFWSVSSKTEPVAPVRSKGPEFRVTAIVGLHDLRLHNETGDAWETCSVVLSGGGGTTFLALNPHATAYLQYRDFVMNSGRPMTDSDAARAASEAFTLRCYGTAVGVCGRGRLTATRRRGQNRQAGHDHCFFA